MSQSTAPDSGTKRQRLLRTVLRLGTVVLLVLVVKAGFDAISAQLALMEDDTAARAMTGMIVIVLLGYALLLAIPFVPAIEIGIAILMIAGANAAPFVYVATVMGMSLAYFTGRHVALNWLIRLCADLRVQRFASMLENARDRTPADRLSDLDDRLPPWLAPFVVRYRYVMLAVLINIPGTVAIGGGGGIMLIAGISRLFHPGWTVLTIVLATLPVPLAVWVLGGDILQ